MEDEEYKKWYNKNREETLEIFNYAQRRIDEVLLIVTIPALGIFLGCLEKLGYPTDSYMSILMILTVIGFLIVIFFNILSLYTTVKSSQARIKNLDIDSQKSQTQRYDEMVDVYHSACWDNMTKLFNGCSIIMFVVGFVSLILFVIFSIKN